MEMSEKRKKIKWPQIVNFLRSEAEYTHVLYNEALDGALAK